MKRTATVGLLALASWSAQAAHEVPIWRAGIEGSFSEFNTLSDNATGFKLFGQYQFNKWFGIEGAYHGIGDFEDESPDGFPSDTLKLNFSGFSAQGVLYVPWPFDFLGWQTFDGIQTFAKAGYYDFDDQLSVNSATTSSSTESGLVAGGGLVFDISDNLGIRAEYEWFDAEVGDISSVSLGFVYNFGGAEPAAPAAMAVAAPPPEPVAAPPPPPPPPADSDGDGVTDDRDACPGTPAGARVNARGCEEQLVLQGVTFENNSAQLTANSTLTLDSVAEILKQRPNFRIEVRGHTDSAGSDEYNMNLSQGRADAVMEYLVGRGVPADKLSATGYGETQPVASNDTDEGRAQNRRVALEFTESN